MAKLMAVLLKTAKSSLVIYVSKWVNANVFKSLAKVRARGKGNQTTVPN